jgi:inositol phosphorylceramide synthase catalytic subunit
MKGSPGGLARIDALFHSEAYTVAFSSAPVVFGAFPSLHSGCATFEAIFISHFFPSLRVLAWAYAGLLYWSTMYLTHHYLVDVVGGACLAAASFYYFIPPEFRKGSPLEKNKYESYDLEAPNTQPTGFESEFSSDEDSRIDISYRSSRPINTASPVKSFILPSSSSRPGGRSHRHTASIASLVGPESQVEDTRSPIGTTGFHISKENQGKHVTIMQ